MAGFARPTTTQTPDVLFDYWLSRLQGSELRVILYAIRRTFGFKKEHDAISREQFLHGITTRDGRVFDQGTGIAAGKTLTVAITSLVRQGLLQQEKRFSAEAGYQVSIYRTNLSDEPHQRASYGFRPVNTTQVPDDLFDVWMPQLGDAELRVLLYIVRRTLGFRKQADAIKVEQFLRGIVTQDGRVLDEGCGVKTKESLYRALNTLREHHLIRSEERRSIIRGSLATQYTLMFEGDLPLILLPDPRSTPVEPPQAEQDLPSDPRLRTVAWPTSEDVPNEPATPPDVSTPSLGYSAALPPSVSRQGEGELTDLPWLLTPTPQGSLTAPPGSSTRHPQVDSIDLPGSMGENPPAGAELISRPGANSVGRPC